MDSINARELNEILITLAFNSIEWIQGGVVQEVVIVDEETFNSIEWIPDFITKVSGKVVEFFQFH